MTYHYIRTGFAAQSKRQQRKDFLEQFHEHRGHPDLRRQGDRQRAGQLPVEVAGWGVVGRRRYHHGQCVQHRSRPAASHLQRRRMLSRLTSWGAVGSERHGFDDGTAIFLLRVLIFVLNNTPMRIECVCLSPCCLYISLTSLRRVSASMRLVSTLVTISPFVSKPVHLATSERLCCSAAGPSACTNERFHSMNHRTLTSGNEPDDTPLQLLHRKLDALFHAQPHAGDVAPCLLGLGLGQPTLHLC